MDEDDSEINITWFNKVLLIFWPSMAVRRLAKKMGIADSPFERAHLLFDSIDRIDVLPLADGESGFILVLDRSTALYFYQNGDGFAYDGFEIGEYRKGDVSIFERAP